MYLKVTHHRFLNFTKSILVTPHTNNLYNYLTSLLAGLLCTLGFSPFDYGFIPIISMLLLFKSIYLLPCKQSSICGFLFGIGLFATGISWVFVSIYSFSDAGFVISLLLTVLFISIMSVFPLLQCLLIKKLFAKTKPITLILGYTSVWCVFSYLREHLFTGFPWLILGYSQTSTLLAHYATLFGIHFVTLLTVLTSTLIFAIFNYQKRVRYISILAVMLIWLGGYGVSKIAWTTPINKEKISVSVLQGNIQQTNKWQPEYLYKIMSIYSNMLNKAWDSKIIILPETAFPVFAKHITPFLNEIKTQANQHNAAVLLGVPVLDAATSKYYNAAVILGKGNGRYLKRHLVPFGEYIPFAKYLTWFFKILNIPMADFSQGNQQQPLLTLHNFKVAVFICYEIIFSDQVREQLQQANFIINISDDSWFGKSIGTFQQLQMAKMRSLETGRYLIYADNTGITAIINPQGNVIKEIAPFKSLILKGNIQAMQGVTPFMRFGDWAFFILLLCMLLISVIVKPKR